MDGETSGSYARKNHGEKKKFQISNLKGDVRYLLEVKSSYSPCGEQLKSTWRAVQVNLASENGE